MNARRARCCATLTHNNRARLGRARLIAGRVACARARSMRPCKPRRRRGLRHRTVAIAMATTMLPCCTHAMACERTNYEHAVARSLARSQHNASAAAAAFMHACQGHRWSNLDVKRYLASTWHPGGPTGASCSSLSRIGVYGDGGIELCNAESTLSLSSAGGAPCRVVSVGTGADVSFSRAIRALSPACTVDVFAGSSAMQSSGHRQQQQLAGVRFHSVPLSTQSWQQTAGGAKHLDHSNHAGGCGTFNRGP